MNKEFWNILFFTIFFIAACTIYIEELPRAVMIAAGLLFLKQWKECDG